MSTTISPTISTNSIHHTVDVPFIHSSEKSNMYNCIEDAIIQKLQKIPELQKLWLNPESTLLVCNIINNSISNNFKHHKIDKKQVATEILTAPFGLSPKEIQQLKD